MSSKRKWDQQGPDDQGASKGAKTEDSKSTSNAAAAAAAIAAKIAAQFANGGGVGGGGLTPYEGEFTHDIDINDVRNRYLLTKGSTQEQIHEETGASVGTRGVWYPDRTKATAKDPPLYIHISANSKDVLQKAIDKVNELITMDLGSLVEKNDKQRERRKWPEEKLPIGLESIRNFNIRAKTVGPSGSYMKHIQQETSTRVQIKGIGSGFIDQETGQEEPVPMYIHITGPEEGQVARAKVLADDLLEVLHQEYAKMQTFIQQQQMELHQAQQQYAYMSGYAPPPPSAPPPPGDQPPPPPPDGSAPPPPPPPDGSATAYSAPPAPTDKEAYAAYWSTYGYDVNSKEFKDWQESQQQQYAQYYAAYATAASNQSPPPPPPPA